MAEISASLEDEVRADLVRVAARAEGAVPRTAEMGRMKSFDYRS